MGCAILLRRLINTLLARGKEPLFAERFAVTDEGAKLLSLDGFLPDVYSREKVTKYIVLPTEQSAKILNAPYAVEYVLKTTYPLGRNYGISNRDKLLRGPESAHYRARQEGLSFVPLSYIDELGGTSFPDDLF